MTPLLYALVAAMANLAGALAVTVRRAWSTRSLELLIAFAAGFMLSVSIADILPEAILRDGESAALMALAGFVLVHLTQHAMVGHFHFGEETHPVAPHVRVSALIGLLMHTFVDGVAIASGFAVSARLGVLIFGAVFLHKLPEGLAISSLTLAAGGSRKAAVGAAALLGVATLVGFAMATQLESLARVGLALSGGVTLYVGASNLIPEFQGKPGWWHSGVFFGGCALYLVARVALRM